MDAAQNAVVAVTTEIVAKRYVPVVKLSVTVPAAAVPVHHDEKPEKFNGHNFKRWQQNMLFYFTTLNLADRKSVV